MLSKEPLIVSSLPNQTSREQVVSLLALNQEVFQFLLAFIEMSKGFKFGFVEINFPPDADVLLTALQEHPKCDRIQFVVLNFDDPELRFLLDELKQALPKVDRQTDKKIVLVLRGLERAIATTGDYPPILTNLNYARDNFPAMVPYPTLFVLPEYAVTRFAQFAPDFWAWTAATFKFQTAKITLDRAIQESASDRSISRTYAKPERHERIDLLERLLQEDPEDTEASSRTRLEILTQLGRAYQSIRQFDIAKVYFQSALELSHELGYIPGEAIALFNIGSIYYDLRQFDEAGSSVKQSLVLIESTGDRQSSAYMHHMLGMVAKELRQWDEAKHYYLNALEIFVGFGDHYGQACTYHNLGIVAQEVRQ
jgi:tetratricopeptide (TPR) repeat protein